MAEQDLGNYAENDQQYLRIGAIYAHPVAAVVTDAMVDRALDEMSLEMGEWRTLPAAELILRRAMVRAAVEAALSGGGK